MFEHEAPIFFAVCFCPTLPPSSGRQDAHQRARGGEGQEPNPGVRRVLRGPRWSPSPLLRPIHPIRPKLNIRFFFSEFVTFFMTLFGGKALGCIPS